MRSHPQAINSVIHVVHYWTGYINRSCIVAGKKTASEDEQTMPAPYAACFHVNCGAASGETDDRTTSEKTIAVYRRGRHSNSARVFFLTIKESINGLSLPNNGMILSAH